LPDSALWALALLVGFDLIFGGGSLVVIALKGRRVICLASRNVGRPQRSSLPGNSGRYNDLLLTLL
jgi:hypothetical protein